MPTADYLSHLVESRNLSAGTVLGTARIIKDWFSFLAAKRVDWIDANNELVKRWATSQEKRARKRRIQRKVEVVFDFYRTVQSEFGWLDRVIGPQSALPNAWKFPLSFEIITKMKKDGTSVEKLRPSFHYPTLTKSRRRPTPTPEQVGQIKDKLLEIPTTERATFWWLSAGWMHDSGLRLEGVAGLTLEALSTALADEGILGPSGKPWTLGSLARDHVAQDRIKLSISALREDCREYVLVRVTEKGGKARDVPLNLDTLEHNLDYVWGARDALVRDRFMRRSSYEPSDALFLSYKTGKAFQPKSLGNALKLVFNALRIPGSAHRLRAFFASKITRKTYLRARAIHGRVLDQRSILLEAAEAMGHERPETLEPYVNDARREENSAPGEPVLITSSSDARLVRGLADRLDEPNSKISRAFLAFCREHGVEPRDEANSLLDLELALEKRKARHAAMEPQVSGVK